MLVRAGDGEWQQLRPATELPPGGFRALCGHDAANLLELDEPMPVAAFGEPGDDGMVDAICLTPDGGIALLAATFEQRPDATLWRLLNVAGALRGMSWELFSANCTELQGAPPAQWLAERTGADAAWLEGRMREVLETGSFEFVLVTSNGPGELATPMRFVQLGPASVRAYEVEIMRAGDVQAVEGAEITLDGERAEGTRPRRLELVHDADAAPAAQEWQPEDAPQPEPAPAAGWTPESAFEQAAEAFEAERSSEEQQPEPVAEEPQPEPQAEEAQPEPQAEEAQPEPELEPEAEAEQPEEQPQAQAEAPQVATEVEPEPLGEPSTEESFVASVDRLDHKSSAHMRYLHGRLLALVGATEYTRDERLEYFVGWTREEQPRPLVGLDSEGSFTVVLSSLPQEEQAEYAAELASLADGDPATFMQLGVAELSVPQHLNDQTLLEYVVDNLQEALPGGRELFQTGTQPAPEAEEEPSEAEAALARPAQSLLAAELDDEEIGDDFFAGVSAEHDPTEIAEATGQPAPEEPASEPAATEPPRPQQQSKGGFARRLRRRDAA